MRKKVKIGNLGIGDDEPVRLVAELGVNHLGDHGRMKDMIDAAIDSGADFLKFQTYNASLRYDPKTNPKGEEFIDLVTRWQFDKKTEEKIWEYAISKKAKIFTSPFDKPSVELGEELGSLAYKVPAFEIVNTKLLSSIAETRKPVVISRGMATMDETEAAVELFEKKGVEVILLHCISSYPTMHSDSNLWMIHTLRNKFNIPIGHSDHTRGIDIPILAVAAGARIIEKHFTINPKLRESDNPFSITPDELRIMRFNVDNVDTYMGQKNITIVDAEKFMASFRRQS